MSNGQEGRTAQLLKDRGVSESLLPEFASLPEQTVLSIVARFDGDPSASTGALVFRLRQAVENLSKPIVAKRDVGAQQAEYGRDVAAWIAENLPQFDRPRFGPHPAAVAAVIRLDYLHGKSNRRKSVYGPAIRGAVNEWERKFGDDAEAAA